MSRLWQVKSWTYVACGRCGHAWLEPLPTFRDAELVYQSDYFQSGANGGYANYLADEALHRANARDRLARIGRCGKSRGKLLDIGCAAGFFLDEARRAGWDVLGADCSTWAREAAAKRGLPVVSWSDLSGNLPSGFDVIALCQVLEHMVDPCETIETTARLLAPGGVLFIETWDRGSVVARLFGRYWQQVTPPSVLHLFTRPSLRCLIDAKRFADVKIETSGKRVSAEFVGNLLQQKFPRLLPGLNWLTGRHFLGRFSARYSLGDLITLTARKADAVAINIQSG